MPFAQVEIGLRKDGAHGGRQAKVAVADDTWRGAAQSAQKDLPVGPSLGRKCLHSPHSGAAVLVAHGAEHAKRDPGRAAIGLGDAKRHIVEQ